MNKPLVLFLAATLGCACSGPEAQATLGNLSLALSAQAGGETYRLVHGDFTLQGPEAQQFSVADADPIRLTLPVGSYTLALAEGWVLARADDQSMTAVAASLESQNPALLVVGPGATTQTTLRFALSDGTSVQMATGELEIGIALGDDTDDAGIAAAAACTQGLIVNEVDYEQSGADNAEFVEIVNTAGCAAQLGAVSLELVNGGDGNVYARTALAPAGASLEPGARLVVGHANVLSALPASVLRVPLGSGGLQNGAPDAVRIVEGARLIDAFSYEGSVNGAVEGTGAGSDDGEGAFSRCPDGFDSQDNSVDFRLVPATPGAPNACP